MPCDQVRTTSVNLEVADIGLLAAALESLGYSVTAQSATRLAAHHPEHGSVSFNRETQKLEQRANSYQTPQAASEIAVGYGTAVVKKVATRFGWSLKQDTLKPGAVAAASFTAKKRSV